jgi:hypothetical protein
VTLGNMEQHLIKAMVLETGSAGSSAPEMTAQQVSSKAPRGEGTGGLHHAWRPAR